jgi:hypothetical protein
MVDLLIAAALAEEVLTATLKPATLRPFIPANRKGVIAKKTVVWAVLLLQIAHA